MGNIPRPHSAASYSLARFICPEPPLANRRMLAAGNQPTFDTDGIGGAGGWQLMPYGFKEA